MGTTNFVGCLYYMVGNLDRDHVPQLSYEYGPGAITHPLDLYDLFLSIFCWRFRHIADLLPGGQVDVNLSICAVFVPDNCLHLNGCVGQWLYGVFIWVVAVETQVIVLGQGRD